MTSPTSLAARDSIEGVAASMRKAVLEAIRAAGANGMTDSELQEQLGMQGSSERPRRIELQQAGLIEQSGEVRMTASGRRAVCWVAK